MTIESQIQQGKINRGNINRLESIRHAHTVRREECTDRMEDCLEVIYELIRQKGYATAIDISESLSVSSPSVTKMLEIR